MNTEDNSSVLFVIDMQEQCLKHLEPAVREELLANVQTLIAACRGKMPIVHVCAKGMPVIGLERWVSQNIFTPEYLDCYGESRKENGISIMGQFAYTVDQRDYIFFKRDASVFFDHPMAVDMRGPVQTMVDYVKKQGWKNIILAGVYEDKCVYCTAVDAKKAQLNPLLVSDCIAAVSDSGDLNSANRHAQLATFYSKYGHVFQLKDMLEVVRNTPDLPTPTRKTPRGVYTLDDSGLIIHAPA